MPNGWRSVVPAWSCAGVSSHDGFALIRVGQRPEQRFARPLFRGDMASARRRQTPSKYFEGVCQWDVFVSNHPKSSFTPDGHGYAVARNRGVRSAEKRAARLDRMYARRAERPGAVAAREGTEGAGQSEAG